MSTYPIPKCLFDKEIRKKKVFSHFCIQDRNIFCIFAPDYNLVAMISVETDELRGWSLHDGKASHDALSIGNLKLPQKDVCQRQCRVDVTGMLKSIPSCA